MPKRIQRKRTKGWKMPPNAVYVGRPTKWGNPCTVGEPHPYDSADGEPLTAQECVDIYRCLYFSPKALEELRGKDLACWCRLDQPCHADVLLELANTKRAEG